MFVPTRVPTTPTTPSTSKGPGWRKPVPQFIPSPPVSAGVLDPPSEAGGRMSLSGSTQDDMPPLPQDWRQALDRAFRSTDSESVVQTGAGSLPEQMRETVSSPTTVQFLNDPYAKSSRSQLSRKGSMPYRPPTPPLPSASRPKSFTTPNAVEARPSLPYRMVTT
ncbi:hypothetical protein FA95DRAFT_1521598 [Auriscalpium vulgare]|uniref:Uncharacterized protein n=1 Tax=Auriscalpium vulgare TaxID=40419 RepID=A0ACB8RM85_9AGAM|nr:hypothetical protein FA95DRAFT_1521598 [Auriscalpium vulgare]